MFTRRKSIFRALRGEFIQNLGDAAITRSNRNQILKKKTRWKFENIQYIFIQVHVSRYFSHKHR